MTSRLAIEGGSPAVPPEMTKYSLNKPILTEEDIQAAIKVLRNGEIMGRVGSPQISALAEEWAAYVGAKYCIVVNSGTAALHAAVAAAGIGPGDEVITTPFSFLTSATAIMYQNGIPVFADIDARTYNIDPKRVEEKINDRTKAILVVHIAGLPCDMDEINAIARKYNLVVIEDACQSHGATYKGKKTGVLGDMGAFSLQWSKNLTTGADGGFLTTNNENFALKAEMVGRFGEILKPDKPRDYQAYTMGWNYRSDEILAAIARSRLKRLDEGNRQRQQNCEYLTKELSKIKGVNPPHVPKDRTHVYYLYIIRFSPEDLGLEIHPRVFREKVEKALTAEGVDIGRWSGQPLFSTVLFKQRVGYGKGCPWECPFGRRVKYQEEDFPVTLRFMDDFAVIWSVQPPNTLELMECYVEAFRKVFENIERVLEYEP